MTLTIKEKPVVKEKDLFEDDNINRPGYDVLDPQSDLIEFIQLDCDYYTENTKASSVSNNSQTNPEESKLE